MEASEIMLIEEVVLLMDPPIRFISLFVGKR